MRKHHFVVLRMIPPDRVESVLTRGVCALDDDPFGPYRRLEPIDPSHWLAVFDNEDDANRFAELDGSEVIAVKRD